MFNIRDDIIVSFDPLECVLDEGLINVDFLLEITDHLIVFGAHVVLCNMIVFKFGDEVWQLNEFIHIKVIFHDEFKHFLFLN